MLAFMRGDVEKIREILGVSHVRALRGKRAMPMSSGYVEEFTILNPLSDQNRFSLRRLEDISSCYNYLFEMDNVELVEQYHLAQQLFKKGIISSAVYSGGKSLHMIIHTNISAIKHYKHVWHELNQKYFLGKADPACSHPNRLTRTAGFRRRSNQKLQALVYAKRHTIDIAPILIEQQKNTTQKPKIEPIVKRAVEHGEIFERDQYLLNVIHKKGEDKYLHFFAGYPMNYNDTISAMRYFWSLTHPLYIGQKLFSIDEIIGMALIAHPSSSDQEAILRMAMKLTR